MKYKERWNPVIGLFRAVLLFSLYCSGFSVIEAAVTTERIEQLEKRLNAYPSNLKLRYVLSRAYAQKARQEPRYYEKSIEQLEEIMKTKQIPVVKFFLGLVYARRGDLDKAIYHWLTIVRSMKPNNLTTLRYLALAYEKKKKHDDSLKYWNKILKINPEDYKAHYHAALVTLRDLSMQDSLRYAVAIRHFEKVLAKYPVHKKSLWYLSQTYKASQQYLKQQNVLKKLIRMMPSNDKIFQEIKLNQKNLQSHPNDVSLATEQEIAQYQQSLDEKPKAEIRRAVANEITDDDFDKAFNEEPEPQEVPIEHEAEPVHKEPTLKPGSILSADAEILFNQGMSYLQHKEYDLALFNFLQAQELDPKFAQCYLQIGEVYLKLADSTPTEDKFKEHLRLSRQALETAVRLEPDSLLAHAANAKTVEVEKKAQQGFEKAHLGVADRAIQDGNVRFAMEEFIILLSNGFSSLDLFFALADILDSIDDGVRLDLRNILDTLASEQKEQIYYLQALLFQSTDIEKSLAQLDKIFALEHKQVAFYKLLKERSEQSSKDALSEYILGRYLLESKAFGPAAERLTRALQTADQAALKNRIQYWLEKAESKPANSSNVGGLQPIAPIVVSGANSSSVGDFEQYDREKKELVEAVSEFSGFFDNPSQMIISTEKLDFLENFVNRSSENGVALYVLSKMLEKSTVPEIKERSAELLRQSLSITDRSAGWYFKMGTLAMKMADYSSSEVFFEQSLFSLLRKGWEVYEPFARELAMQSSRLVEEGKLDVAERFLNIGFRFHPHSVELASAKLKLLDASGAGSFSYAREFFFSLLDNEVFREVVKADVGLAVFWAVFLTLLMFCAVVVILKREELKHLVDELMGEKSLSIPVMTFAGGILLFFFPTGLVLFLPILLWSFIDDFEQIFFGLGIAVLILLPFILPVGYVNNVDYLKSMVLLQNGEIEKVESSYKARMQANPMDLDAKFQVALIRMNQGDLKKSISQFDSILQSDPEFFSALGNVGVAYAKLGEYDKAIGYFSKALKINPIHDKVLYDLSKCYELKGDLKLASKYLKWMGGNGEASRKNIERYLSNKDAQRPIFATFYLEGAVSQHNTLFAPLYQSSLSMSLIMFLVWFFLGGGLIGVLLFLKDRMDIVLTRCSSCEAIICNSCQSVLNGKVTCSDCFDSPERRSKGILKFRRDRELAGAKLSSYFNYCFPGASLVASGKLAIGLLLSCGFWFFTNLWFNNFGTLRSTIFPFDNGFISLLSWLGALVALGLYGCSLASTFFKRQ